MGKENRRKLLIRSEIMNYKFGMYFIKLSLGQQEDVQLVDKLLSLELLGLSAMIVATTNFWPFSKLTVLGSLVR